MTTNQTPSRGLTFRNAISIVVLSIPGDTLLHLIGANKVGAVLGGAVFGVSVFYNLRYMVRTIEASRRAGRSTR